MLRSDGWWRASLTRCLVVAAAAAVTTAAGPGRAAAQQVTVIDVFDFDFGSSSLGMHIDPTIRVGDTVRWNFVDPGHSTTAKSAQAEFWDSGLQSAPFTFDHTFTQTGDFSYYCIAHGFEMNGAVFGMTGVVHVVPIPEPATALFVAALAVGAAYIWRRPAGIGTGRPVDPVPSILGADSDLRGRFTRPAPAARPDCRGGEWAVHPGLACSTAIPARTPPWPLRSLGVLSPSRHRPQPGTATLGTARASALGAVAPAVYAP